MKRLRSLRHVNSFLLIPLAPHLLSRHSRVAPHVPLSSSTRLNTKERAEEDVGKAKLSWFFISPKKLALLLLLEGVKFGEGLFHASNSGAAIAATE